MTPVDCPHCHTRVFLHRGQTQCPACQKDTRDLTGVDRNKTAVWVSSSQQLPMICVECGGDAERKRPVKGFAAIEGEATGPSNAEVLASVFVPFYNLFRLFFGSKSETDNLVAVITINLPYCRHCHATLKPISIDKENRRLKLLVHHEFESALRAASPE